MTLTLARRTPQAALRTAVFDSLPVTVGLIGLVAAPAFRSAAGEVSDRSGDAIPLPEPAIAG